MHMMPSSMSFILMVWAIAAVVYGEVQCGGGAPMKIPPLLYGVHQDQHYSVADNICCHNHDYAERWNFQLLAGVDLFSKLDPNNRTVFYDSVCGIPLFVAPVGRTFQEFKQESVNHGWPSFRPQETVDENVIIHPSGRMESICGTHLGHNLPDWSGARYCIDLVCISGSPLFVTNEVVDEPMATEASQGDNQSDVTGGAGADAGAGVGSSEDGLGDTDSAEGAAASGSQQVQPSGDSPSATQTSSPNSPSSPTSFVDAFHFKSKEDSPGLRIPKWGLIVFVVAGALLAGVLLYCTVRFCRRRRLQAYSKSNLKEGGSPGESVDVGDVNLGGTGNDSDTAYTAVPVNT